LGLLRDEVRRGEVREGGKIVSVAAEEGKGMARFSLSLPQTAH